MTWGNFGVEWYMNLNVADDNDGSKKSSDFSRPVLSGEFIYNQLFELMKLENSRRENLDSKAQTYIGLLSIAITLLVALGAVTIEYAKKELVFSDTVGIMLLFYLCTEFAFIAGTIFAFKAYHTGSPFVEPREGEPKHKYLFNWDLVPGADESKFRETIAKEYKAEWVRKAVLKKESETKIMADETDINGSDTNSLSVDLYPSGMNARLLINNRTCGEFIVKKEGVHDQLHVYKRNKPVFIKMDTRWLLERSYVEKESLYDALIQELWWICESNGRLNNMKSNNILKAYYSTLLAIGFLLMLSALVSLYGIWIK